MAEIRPLFGFKTDYPRIEKSQEDQSKRGKQQQNQDQKKKSEDEDNDVFANLANSLGQYTGSSREFFQ